MQTPMVVASQESRSMREVPHSVLGQREGAMIGEPVWLLFLSKGLIGIISSQDKETFGAHKWCASIRQDGQIYAIRRKVFPDGSSKLVTLHREIMGKSESHIQVDHINGNGLDNRRRNLRFCTPSQNSTNQKLRSTNTTGFRGVTREWGKFVAKITIDGKSNTLLRSTSAKECALAYDRAATIQWGEFARLNFPEGILR